MPETDLKPEFNPNDPQFQELWKKHAPKWVGALDIDFATVKEKIMSEDDLILVIIDCLNSLRNPIAHCSPLAKNEVVRLQLVVQDWFRIME